MNRRRLICQTSIAAFVAALALVPAARAQDIWTGGANGDWSNNNNWQDSSEPTLADSVTFPTPGAGGVVAITLGAGEQALSLTFQDSYALTGGDLTLGAATTIQVDPTFTATINSALIAGGATTSLTKSGAGTLILGGTNTYTGKTIITAGTLSVSADANLGAAPGAAVTDQLTLAGGTLKLTAGITFTGNRGFTANSGANAIDGGGFTTVFNGPVALLNAGTSLTFTTSSGTATTFTLAASPANAPATAAVFIDPNVTLNLGNGGGTGNIGGNTAPLTINAGGTLRFNRNNATSYNQDISGAGQVTIASISGQVVTLNPTIANTYSGGTFFNGGSSVVLATKDSAFGTGAINFIAGAGTIASSSAAARNYASGNAINISGAAGTVTFGQTTGGTGTQTFNGPVTFERGTGVLTRTLSTPTATTFNGVISDTGANAVANTIAFSSSGTRVLRATNTFSGAVSWNSGNVTIAGPDGSIANVPTITVGDNGGADESITVGNLNDVYATAGGLNRLSDTATLALNGAGAAIFNGPAAGSTGFTETFGTLSILAGRGFVTVAPTSGETHALEISTLNRNAGTTLFLRGAGLGGTGAGTSMVTVGNAAALLVGGGGAAGEPTISLIPFAIGDTISTGGGSGFLTNDATAGLRLLSAAEYDTTIAGTNTLRNVTSAGGETVSDDVTINALRMTGGTTSIDAGDRVTVNSGAILFTAAGTLGGAGTVDFGTREGIIQIGNTTPGTVATVNARLSGTGGLTIGGASGSGSNNIIVLGGDNTMTGAVTVNTGATVRLGSSTALNDNAPMSVIVRAGSVLQLFGNNATIRNLAAGNAFQGIINNGGATAATLTTYLTGSQTYGQVLANGGSGALNLVVSAGPAAILTLNTNNTFTGSTEIRTGAVQFSGNNTGSSASTSYALNGGILRITNTSGNLLGTRISDAAAITLNGGAIELDNSNTAATSYSETVGPVTAASGANTITADKAASGSTSTLTLSSLTRQSGATVHFRSENAGTQTNDLGTTTQNRVLINGTVPNDDGIIGGWATVDTGTGREFATYGASGVTALTGQATTIATGPNPTQNVRITASPAALVGNTEINSLNIVQAAAAAVDIGAGNTLRVESGGIIVTGAFGNTFSNGTLTAGNGAAAGGDLVFTVNTGATSTVSSVIADNSGTPGTNVVNLIKASIGTLVLTGANTYSGKTFINGTTIGASGAAAGGTLRITADNNLGTAPAAFLSDAITISGGSTLDLSTGASFELNANRGILIGANANIANSTNVISIGAGTAGNGKTVTYNGAINPVATSEGSLTLKSNLTGTNLDPGKFVGTLSALNVGGSFRFESGTITADGASSVIGRGLQIGVEGPASLTYTGAGGSLTVGKGINATDVLEIGIVNTDPLPSNATIGTSRLDVSALANFTANVDTIRMGVGSTNRTQRALFIGATNNDITALTSILVSRSPGASAVGQNSSMTFGGGVNNVTTPLMNIGEFKGDGTVTVTAGGTLNIGGFGANTMNLNIGNNAGNTGTVAVGTLNATGGTLNGSFNNLVIGSKSGGGLGGGAGTFTVTGVDNKISANSVTISTVSGNTAGGSNVTNGTLNFGGGSFFVNNDVALATIGTNTSTTPTSTGRLNITGGTFHLGGNITRTTTDEVRSNSFVTVDGGTLRGLNPAINDTTQATITASQLALRSGNVIDVASATLAATSGTNSGVAGTTGDALILRDTTLGFAVSLTGGTGGNVHYEAAGGGAGGTISGALDMGAVVRNVNVEDSAGAVADLTISGSISGELGGINKTGAGTLVLSGANSFTGGTTISSGALVASVNGAFGAGDVSILTSAITLSLGTGVTNAIADTSTLSLAGGGVADLADAGFLTLNTGVNETVLGLLLAGSPQVNGTYGAVGSGALFESNEFFSGGGIVTVIPEPGSAAMLLAGLGALAGLRRFRRRVMA